MVRFNTFKKICRSNNFDYATIQEVGNDNVIAVDNIFISKKNWVYFNDKDNKSVLNPAFKLRDIMEICREETENSDDYVFLLFMKDGAVYRVNVVMKQGYTPFVRNNYDSKNIQAISEAIIKYLNTIVGKTIEVVRTDYSEIFSVYNSTSDCEVHSCSEKYIINDFGYDTMCICDVPCIKIHEREDTTSFSHIMNVSLVSSLGACFDNGILKKVGTIVISADNSEYYLRVIDN